MSRIAGIIQKTGQKTQPDQLRSMATAMNCGQDCQVQIVADENVSLVWSGLDEPNIYSDHDVLIVMDGAIYNNLELGLKSNDAEALAQLFKQSSFHEALSNINADFGLAIYDKRNQKLYLARDRFGLKPLYYSDNSSSFVFASKPSGILDFLDTGARANKHFSAVFAGAHYRYFDNHPEESPYEGIKQLQAAHWLSVDPQNILSGGKYWEFKELPDHTDSEEVLAQKYRELLLDAVDIRYKASKNPCFTLSGGMDSSSVLASAVRTQNQKQIAFSTVYNDKTYDETDEIRDMLEANVEKWNPINVASTSIFETVNRMIKCHDEPVATATWLSHFVMCEQVRDLGFGSMFGGLGGDELNAGEYEYYYYRFADIKYAGKDKELEEEVKLWAKYHDHPIYRKNFSIMESELKLMADLGKEGHCLVHPSRLNKYKNAVNPDYYDLASFEPIMDHPFKSYLKNRAYQDMSRETAPCCLRAEDRQTMAFGLENYLPFFDHRLVEFMFRIPGEHKIREGVTKRLLRTAMKDILPEETRNRIKKTGWNAPAHIWFSSEFNSDLKDLISSQSFKERGIYNIKEVERLLKEHEEIVSSGSAKENHMMFFWQLINLELWFQNYIDQKVKV